MKRTIPFLIASIAGFVLIVAYFIPFAEGWGENVSIWFDVLAAIAFILGGGNLLKSHFAKISRRDAGWAYSVVTVAAFAITLFIGLTKVGSPFWWIYQYAFVPLTATVFSLLAFYVASAAFRAFRARNTGAILLLSTTFIILLGRTFAGVFLTSWLPEALSGLRLENLTVDAARFDMVRALMNLIKNMQ